MSNYWDTDPELWQLWTTEVANRDTLLGYHEWTANRRRFELDELEAWREQVGNGDDSHETAVRIAELEGRSGA